MESVMVTKVFTFCAAHRLYGYIGECHHIHGHNYRVAVTITRLASQLDASGMVLDFKVISSSLGKWIDKNLDHTILVSSEDTELKYLLECMEDSRYFLMDNPTAENIAKRIFQVAATYFHPTARASRLSFTKRILAMRRYQYDNPGKTYRPRDFPVYPR
jgi:6-pyruvoyltetrahydropterin/6-carboxytetrahydropterin synthase